MFENISSAATQWKQKDSTLTDTPGLPRSPSLPRSPCKRDTSSLTGGLCEFVCMCVGLNVCMHWCVPVNVFILYVCVCERGTGGVEKRSWLPLAANKGKPEWEGIRIGCWWPLTNLTFLSHLCGFPTTSCSRGSTQRSFLCSSGPSLCLPLVHVKATSADNSGCSKAEVLY